MSFLKTTFSLNRKQRPAFISKPLEPPIIQTSPIFNLPDELILSILSHISPEPQHSDHYTRFRLQYGLTISDYHQERTRFLRPLSMTCKTMRVRLIPWIWGHLELFPQRPHGWGSKRVKNLEILLSLLKDDPCLATTVRFLTVHPTLEEVHIPLFVKCLDALPNLYTLEIAWAEDHVEDRLKKALGHVQLPQIKTLILPATTHPLLEHCREVEDVCVVMPWKEFSEAFLVSLASNRDSRVRRLSIPLLRLKGPSRFVIACPKLTELTVIYPHPFLPGSEGRRRIFTPLSIMYRAMFEITEACEALPDFDTLQIVHFPSTMAISTVLPGGPSRGWYPEEKDTWLGKQRQKIKSQVSLVRDAALIWLKQGGFQEGGGKGRLKATLRVIELESHHPALMVLDSVEVEEYEV